MAAIDGSPQPPSSGFSLLDERILQIIGQIIFALVLVGLFYGVATSIVSALAERDLTPSFAFLGTRAGFDIGEAPDWYSADSTYWQAYQVGLANTLRVVGVGLVASTILGVFMGIFLLSGNWLVRSLARVYVEILRNTPLLVQLFAWYFIGMFSLPQFRDSLAFPQEGIAFIAFNWFLYAILAFFAVRLIRKNSHHDFRYGLIVVGLAAAVFTVEAGFWVANNVAGWQDAYGQGALTLNFFAYLVVSAVLIGAGFFVTDSMWRGRVFGASIGQLVGGLLFYIGALPTGGLRFEVYPAVYMNIRGFAFPEVLATGRFAEWMAFVALGVILAVILWVYFGRIKLATGETSPRLTYAVVSIAVLALVGWMVVTAEPAPQVVPVEGEDGIVFVPVADALADDLLTSEDALLYSTAPLQFNLPTRTNFRYESGTLISPEYMALFLGLTIYTSAFIAEVVRAGIQAVPKGQVEAARALGLTQAQVLQMVVLPQALRVIIPPMGNQYLNLSKNSSLAIGIAFADVTQVMTTTMNQSGQSVTGIALLMVTYLVISLLISAVMNAVNSRMRLVTR